jgi:hypothetical protein
MDRSFIKTIRETHAATYAEQGNTERAKEIATANDIYTPIFKPREVHPEEEPSLSELNMFVTDIGHDLTIINKELAVAGEKFKNLMEDTKLRLGKVQRDIAIEEERLKDLNMLCGDHTEFDTVETLTMDDFQGAASDFDGVFHAKVTSNSDVRLYVVNVQGNGYEGNEFVYKDKKWLADSMDTADREHLVDRSLSSVYEYSRINADESEELAFSLLNHDDVEAECAITLLAESPISMVQVLSDMENLVLKEVSVSDDGAVYRPVTEEEIAFNNKENIYRNGVHAFGSGIITFPMSQYIKLVFRSDGYTDDKIAFSYFDAKM